MSPTQYRALEAVAAAEHPAPIARGLPPAPGQIHPRTAEALERRSLVIRLVDPDGPDRLVISDDGLELLAEAAERRPA